MRRKSTSSRDFTNLLAIVLIAFGTGLLIVGISGATWMALIALTIAPVVLIANCGEPRNTHVSSTSHRLSLGPKNYALVVAIATTALLTWLSLNREGIARLEFEDLSITLLATTILSVGSVLILLRLHVFSFPSVFLGMTFLFTSSAFVLYHTEGWQAFQGWIVVDPEHIAVGMPLIMLAFSAFAVGSLCASRGRSICHGRINHHYSDELYTIGLFLYCSSFLALIVAIGTGSTFAIAYTNGYKEFLTAKASGAIPSYLGKSLSMFLPWSLLVLLAASKTKKRLVSAMLLSLPAVALMLMWGGRREPLAIMILMASGSYLLGYSITWKRTLIILTAVALLIPVVMNLRSTPSNQWSLALLGQAANNEVGGIHAHGRTSLVATGLGDMGTSYQTLMATVELVPERESYRYGSDYLRSLAVAIPFAQTVFSPFGIDLVENQPVNWITDRLDAKEVGLGYLQVAEAYLQFGVLGILGLYFGLGWCLPKLWWHLQSGEQDSRKLALVLITMMALMHWIRNDATGMVRYFAWGWILTYALPFCLHARRKRARPRRSARQSTPRLTQASLSDQEFHGF